jgi:hypothetical protein|nr:MAG TPA: hypothetical protein [Caudoviricetes sp.]
MNKKLVLMGLATMLKEPDSPFFGNQIQLLTPVGLLSGDFVWSDDKKPAAVASMRLALKLISQAISDNNRPNSGSPDKTDKPHLLGDEQSVLLKNVTLYSGAQTAHIAVLMVYVSDIIGISIGNAEYTP